jgi:hypothetical protein
LKRKDISEELVRKAISKQSNTKDWLKRSDIPQEDLIKTIQFQVSRNMFWRIIEDMVENNELEVRYIEPDRNFRSKEFRLKKNRMDSNAQT